MKVYSLNVLNSDVLLLDGTPAKMATETSTLVKLTVRMALRTALTSDYPDEMPSEQNRQGVSWETKLKRYDIAKKFWNADSDLELKTEEQAELKICVTKRFSGELLGYLIHEVVEKSTKPVMEKPTKSKLQ